MTGATPLHQNTFASGLLTTPGGRQFGVIRIPLFQQREYGATCETAWESFRKGRSGSCDETCQEQFEASAKQEIAQALAQQGQMLSEDQRVELQRQLAELDARLRALIPFRR